MPKRHGDLFGNSSTSDHLANFHNSISSFSLKALLNHYCQNVLVLKRKTSDQEILGSTPSRRTNYSPMLINVPLIRALKKDK